MTSVWDERYAGDEYHFGTEPNAFLASQQSLLKPGMSCLAVADGEGRNGVWLAGQGLEKFDPMNTGGTTDQGGFTVTMVRADHSSGDIKDGMPIYLGNPCGVIVKAKGEPTVYHMGDTDLFGDMALINEIHQPKVAFAPIGDRFTMNPANAAFAVKRFFKLDAVVPCHYGSFPIIEPNADKFVAAMAGHRTKVIVPDKGKAFTI